MIRRHALGFICLALLIDTIGFGIVIPVLPRLLMSVAHTDVSEAARIGGWLAVVFSALQFVSGPILGNLSDRFGRRPVLLCSMAAFGADYLLMAWAPTLAWLFVGRALAGIAGALYSPAAAYIADVSPPEKRAGAFGMMGAMFGLGFIIGPVLGGWIAGQGERAPFMVAAGLALTNAAYGYFVLPESLPPARRRPFDWTRANPFATLAAFGRYPAVLGVAAALFLWLLAHQVYPATWGFFTTARFQWDPNQIAWSLAYVGVLMAFVQGFVTGKLVPRIGEWNAAVLGIACGTVTFAALAFASSAWMVYAAMTVGALQGLSMASMQAMMSRRVPANAQGELQGGVASLQALTMILAPFLLTRALAWGTDPAHGARFPGAAFAVAAVLGAACLALLLATRSRGRTEPGGGSVVRGADTGVAGPASGVPDPPGG